MDDLNIMMEEHIQLIADKARGRDQTFNWEIATYNKEYYDDLDSFTDFETKITAIVYNDAPKLTQNVSSKLTDYIRRILGFGIRRIVTCTVVCLIVSVYCR
nr:hypothetical protein [Tanacetum cinerariifolium]